jgi:hypothetical protein
MLSKKIGPYENGCCEWLCDWVMTSNYILDTINSFKTNGCIRFLERSGLSQNRKSEETRYYKIKKSPFFPFTVSAKEWRI